MGWDVFRTLADCSSTEESQYNLLMFLIETVHVSYPSLVNWIDAFGALEELRVDEGEIRERTKKLFVQLKIISKVVSAHDEEKADSALMDIVNATEETLKAFDKELTDVQAKCDALSIYFGFMTKRNEKFGR